MKRKLLYALIFALLLLFAGGWAVIANTDHLAIEDVLCGPSHFPEDDDCHDPTEEPGCQGRFFVQGISWKGFKCSCQISCEQRPPGGVMPVKKRHHREFGD